MEIFTKSAQETQGFGAKFSSSLKGGEVLALVGGLGAGKTTFVQGLVRGLGISDKVISPTFVLMRSYKINDKSFHHIDLYRLEGEIEKEFKNLGIEELWGKSENIVVIEWADRIKELLPKDVIWIKFEQEGDERKIIVTQ